MKRKTYTCEREIPDRVDVVYGIEQYYLLLKSVAFDLEEHTFLPGLPKEDRDPLYNDMKALNRVIKDLGYFVEDAMAFEEEVEQKKADKVQKQKEEK